jgi:hypothetical protein
MRHTTTATATATTNNNDNRENVGGGNSDVGSSSRLSLHRKWLSFRVLEGRSRARQEEEASSSFPYRPHQYNPLPVHHRPAAHAALGCVIACVIVPCGLNDAPFAGSVHLRGIVQATFCVVAAGMYCAYMLMSYVLSIVLACAEEKAGGHGSVLLRRTRRQDGNEAFALEDDDEDNEDNEDNENDEDNEDTDDEYGAKRHPTDLDWMAEEEEDSLTPHTRNNNNIKSTNASKQNENDTAKGKEEALAAAAAAGAGVSEEKQQQQQQRKRSTRFDSFCNDDAMQSSSSSSVAAPLLRRATSGTTDSSSSSSNRGRGRGGSRRRASVRYSMHGNSNLNHSSISSRNSFGRRLVMRFVGLPREVVVSSMYLGGTGTFLAVAPLCMWDCAVTLAFLVSLFLIALMDTSRTAIIHRSRAYWALAVVLSLTLAFAIAIEASSRLPQLASSALIADYVRLHPLFFATALLTEEDTKNGAALLLLPPSSSLSSSLNGSSGSSRLPPPLLLPDADTEAALLLAQAGHTSLWPFLILAACSPILLRAGGGGVYVGGLYHSMTPSQTLETGLPVNGLLAGLVLAWFSPLESALVHTQNLVRHGYFVAMLVLAPAALAATLALLLHALRRRTALISVAVLLFALMIRQQTLHRALGQHNALDVWGLCCAALSLLLAAWLVCCSSSFAVHHNLLGAPAAASSGKGATAGSGSSSSASFRRGPASRAHEREDFDAIGATDLEEARPLHGTLSGGSDACT